MPWNGTGTYAPPGASFPEVNGTTIDAARFNATLNDVAAGVTAAIAKNGENAATANLPMGTFLHINLGQASGIGQTLAWGKNISVANYDGSGSFTLTNAAWFPRIASVKSAVGTWYTGGDGAGANTDWQVSLNATAPFLSLSSGGANTFQNASFFPRIGLFKTAVGTWYVGGDGVGGNNNFQVSLNAVAPYLSISSATGLTSVSSGLTVTGTTTSTAFTGPLTGNVTGNVSGSSGSTTGNAATATALQTPRTIGGTSFDGTANIAVALAATATALATPRTIGGTSFDGTANIAVALAATATALATPRTIGGTSFDGTANIAVALAATASALAPGANINGVAFTGAGNITVAAAAGTLTGASLNGTVTASSLTSAGATLNLVGGTAGALSIGSAITRYESAETACPSGTYTDTAVAHGGPRVPDLIQVVLRCKTIEAGFAVGDEINMQNDVGDATNQASQTYANATNIGIQIIRSGANPPAIRHKTTGVLTTLTAVNWKLVFRAHWL